MVFSIIILVALFVIGICFENASLKGSLDDISADRSLTENARALANAENPVLKMLGQFFITLSLGTLWLVLIDGNGFGIANVATCLLGATIITTLYFVVIFVADKIIDKIRERLYR